MKEGKTPAPARKLGAAWLRPRLHFLQTIGAQTRPKAARTQDCLGKPARNPGRTCSYAVAKPTRDLQADCTYLFRCFSHLHLARERLKCGWLGALVPSHAACNGPGTHR